MPSIFLQKLMDGLLKSIIDHLIRGVWGLLSALLPSAMNIVVNNTDKVPTPQTFIEPFHIDLSRYMIGFISAQVMNGAVSGLLTGLGTVAWLYLRGRSAFLPITGDRVKRASRTALRVGLAGTVGSYIGTLVVLKPPMWINLLATHLGPGTLALWISLGIGLLLSLAATLFAFAGMVFALAPSSVRVLAAPPPLRPTFRLLSL